MVGRRLAGSSNWKRQAQDREKGEILFLRFQPDLVSGATKKVPYGWKYHKVPSVGRANSKAEIETTTNNGLLPPLSECLDKFTSLVERKTIHFMGIEPSI
jgi:hypothetical protein